MKKYHKIIWEIEQIVNIQAQLQNIIRLAEEANIQIAEIETTILQASDNYWTQTVRDIFSISEDLQNIVQSDMKNQVYHIQKLLVDELDNCKGKENTYADRHIKEIQDACKQDNQEMKKLEMEDKGKQWVQDEEVFLYKPYDMAPSRPKTPEPMFIQNKIDNLKKYMKYIVITYLNNSILSTISLQNYMILRRTRQTLLERNSSQVLKKEI